VIDFEHPGLISTTY